MRIPHGGEYDDARRREQAAAEGHIELLQLDQRHLLEGLSGSDVGLWNWDILRDEMTFDRHWAELLGYSPAEILPRREMHRWCAHPDDWKFVRAAIDAHLQGKTPCFETEHRLRDRSGRWRWFLDRGRVVERDEVGRPVRAAGMYMEVTYRKQAELAAWDSEARFRTAFEGAGLGLAMSDVGPSGMILEGNTALERMLGCTRGGLVGRQLVELIHPEDAERFLGFWAGLASGQASCFRIELGLTRIARSRDAEPPDARRLPGEPDLWVRMSASLVSDAGSHPQFATVIVEDVTQEYLAHRKARAERKLLRKLIDLNDRERQALTYSLHDDLVPDLVGAKLMVDGALGQPGTPQAERALATVVRLLERAIRQGRGMISDLRPLIIEEKGIVQAVQHLAEERRLNGTLAVGFEHEVQFERLPQLLEGTIYRIVHQAVDNVERHAKTDRVLVRLQQQGDLIDLLIEDAGIGFLPEQVPADRFGLQSILELARLFGGRATVRSRPGSGTRIHVRLPLELPVEEQLPGEEWPASGFRPDPPQDESP